MKRREFLAEASAVALLSALPRSASALGRTPLGGRITMHLPWPTSAIDPHDLRDPAAALFGGAIADPVYALDPSGNPYPALASALPTHEGADMVVRLREGLRTSQMTPLDGRDLIASVERARARGAAALLADIPTGRPHPSDPTAALFGAVDAARLSRALASPLIALLPRKFNPSAPDGTGPFHAEPSSNKLVLKRNVAAARGHAFLDAVEVELADDLKASLRAFETERDDLGWLGTGLFDGRKGAVKFDMGRAAWIVLATGPDAGSFGSPGAAQQLCDALPTERLAHLSLGVLPRATGDPAWGGPACDLLVDESCIHLVEVARAVAPILSRPGHEVTPAPIPRAELSKRRAHGKATLAIDLVRTLGPGPLSALIALATADDVARAKDIVRHPPKLAANATPRTVTSTLRVGVLGEMRVSGGVVPDIVLARSASGEGWDLGGTFRRLAPGRASAK